MTSHSIGLTKMIKVICKVDFKEYHKRRNVNMELKKGTIVELNDNKADELAMNFAFLQKDQYKVVQSKFKDGDTTWYECVGLKCGKTEILPDTWFNVVEDAKDKEEHKEEALDELIDALTNLFDDISELKDEFNTHHEDGECEDTETQEYDDIELTIKYDGDSIKFELDDENFDIEKVDVDYCTLYNTVDTLYRLLGLIND